MKLCEKCGCTEATVSYTGELKEELICMDCFNKIISTDLGVELEEQPLTVSIPDYQGVMRNFNIEKMILPNGIFLEAKEDISYGYIRFLFMVNWIVINIYYFRNLSIK